MLIHSITVSYLTKEAAYELHYELCRVWAAPRDLIVFFYSDTWHVSIHELKDVLNLYPLLSYLFDLGYKEVSVTSREASVISREA